MNIIGQKFKLWIATLSQKSVVSSSEEIYILDNGVSKRTTIEAINNFIRSLYLTQNTVAISDGVKLVSSPITWNQDTNTLSIPNGTLAIGQVIATNQPQYIPSQFSLAKLNFLKKN